MKADTNLNDLALFAAIVKHGSLSAAATATGQTKSKISRRLAVLEDQLGLRLVQRSTRAIHITEVGSDFFKYCEAMLDAAQGAMNLARQIVEQPRGVLRVSSPAGLAHLFLMDLLPQFMQAFPDVQVALELTNRRVDLIAEGFDVALRVRTALPDSELILRNLGISPQVLVASPSFVKRYGPFDCPESLIGRPAIGARGDHGDTSTWTLEDEGGKAVTLSFKSSLQVAYGPILKQAVLQGVGIAQLPLNICHEEILSNELVLLLPQMRLPDHHLHLVYGSSKGLSPAIRAFSNFLVDHLRPQMKAIEVLRDNLADRQD